MILQLQFPILWSLSAVALIAMVGLTWAVVKFDGGDFLWGGFGLSALISYIIITLDGSRTQYLVEDSRLTTVKAGDGIDMACTLQWNYGARDQYNCALAGN